MEPVQSIFVRALENGLFYEASQLFLARWRKLVRAGHRDEKIYKALMHGAAAYDFLRKGDIRRAKESWKIYRKYRGLIRQGVGYFAFLKHADELLLRMQRKYADILTPVIV